MLLQLLVYQGSAKGEGFSFMEANNGSCHLFGRLLYTRLEIMDVLRLIHRQYGNPESIYHFSYFYLGEEVTQCDTVIESGSHGP